MFFKILLFLLPFTINAVSLNQNANQVVIAADDPYWTGECKNENMPQSPINLSPPFTFMDFSATFNFQPQHEGQLYNDGGFNLKMDGDFGNFNYNGKIFNSYEISFKSPSEHTFGPQNNRFPLEMQISSISPEGIRVMIAIMFSKSNDDGEFLADFGFGDGLLQHLTTNQIYQIKKPINLANVVPTDNKFFIYEGSKTTPPCEPALWFVAFQTYKISDKQLNDFPKQLLHKDRAISLVTREVYSTFDPKKEQKGNDNQSTSATGAGTDQTPPAKAKSPNVDSFEIVGDDTPYEDEIYPALKDIPNPRPLKNEDYIVVTTTGDAKPYLDFLKLNKDKVNSLLTTLEDDKVTKNMEKAEAQSSALAAAAQASSGEPQQQEGYVNTDSLLDSLDLSRKDSKCNIVDENTKNNQSNANPSDKVLLALIGTDLDKPTNFFEKTSKPEEASQENVSTKESVVSVIHHHGNRDPSSFFSDFHKNENFEWQTMQDDDNVPLSFLELNTNIQTNDHQSYGLRDLLSQLDSESDIIKVHVDSLPNEDNLLGILENLNNELNVNAQKDLQSQNNQLSKQVQTSSLEDLLIKSGETELTKDYESINQDQDSFRNILEKLNKETNLNPFGSSSETLEYKPKIESSNDNYDTDQNDKEYSLRFAFHNSIESDLQPQVYQSNYKNDDNFELLQKEEVNKESQTEIAATSSSNVNKENLNSEDPILQSLKDALNQESKDSHSLSGEQIEACLILHNEESKNGEGDTRSTNQSSDLNGGLESLKDILNKHNNEDHSLSATQDQNDLSLEGSQTSQISTPQDANKLNQDSKGLSTESLANAINESKTEDHSLSPMQSQNTYSLEEMLKSSEVKIQSTLDSNNNNGQKETVPVDPNTSQSASLNESPSKEKAKEDLISKLTNQYTATESSPVANSQTSASSQLGENEYSLRYAVAPPQNNPNTEQGDILQNQVSSTESTESAESTESVETLSQNETANQSTPETVTESTGVNTSEQTNETVEISAQQSVSNNVSESNQNGQQSTVSKPNLRGAKLSQTTEQSSATQTPSETSTEANQSNADSNFNRQDIEQGKEESAEETLQEGTTVTYGPKVPGSVRKKFETEGGKGSMAYNKENKWDGFNIIDTSEWPDMCKLGQYQSPINIDFGSKFKMEPNKLTFAYQKDPNTYCELQNDGYKILLNGDFGVARYGDHPFYAEEVHFHYPSEHTFGENMERTDMEIQIIHRDNFGLTIGVAIFLKISDGTSNDFLSSLGFVNGAEPKSLLGGDKYFIEASKIDLNQLVDGAFDYIKYEGSLTTPPCSENVQWFLFNKRVQVSTENIQRFKQVIGKESNIRGLQPLNEREIWLF